MLVKMFVGGLVAWQTAVLLREHFQVRSHYEMALAAARLHQKPLLVVGGPAAGAKRWALVRMLKVLRHGCGDVCLDIDTSTCRVCGGDVEVVDGDVRAIPFPDGEFGAAFVGHVLEHLPTAEDAALAWGELCRVADEVHIVSPSKQSLIAWFHPDHKLWVSEQGNMLEFTPRAGERLFAGA